MATVSRSGEPPGRTGSRLALDLHLVARPEPEDQPSARQVIDGRGGHRDRGRAADEHAGDGGPELDARGRDRAGAEDRELIAGVAFGHPGGLVTELFGEPYAVDDLTGVRPLLLKPTPVRMTGK